MAEEEFHFELPNGFQLQQFRIDRVLGKGGFGITYQATDTGLNKTVAIKELLPDGIATRGPEMTVVPIFSSKTEEFELALNDFRAEARVLAQFDHPNIVRIHQVFEALGTAYCVMQIIEGESLQERLAREPGMKLDELQPIFQQTLQGLAEVHAQNILHRDIKPGNIMLQPDGTPVLLDFGAARQRASEKSQMMTAILTPGYAPLEQYSGEAAFQGPWTDFYALAAVAYRCLKGKTPPDSQKRFQALRAQQPDPAESLLEGHETLTKPQALFLQAVQAGLRLDEKDRPQSVEEWNRLLSGEETISTTRLSSEGLALLEAREKLRSAVSKGKKALHTVSGESLTVGGKLFRLLGTGLAWLLRTLARIFKTTARILETALSRLIPFFRGQFRIVLGIWKRRIQAKFSRLGTRILDTANQPRGYPLAVLLLLIRLDFVRKLQTPGPIIRVVLARSAWQKVTSLPTRKWAQRRSFRQ